nr:MAG TPA: hypothetical protein [Caudoviricetes sp.]
MKENDWFNGEFRTVEAVDKTPILIWEFFLGNSTYIKIDIRKDKIVSKKEDNIFFISIYKHDGLKRYIQIKSFKRVPYYVVLEIMGELYGNEGLV